MVSFFVVGVVVMREEPTTLTVIGPIVSCLANVLAPILDFREAFVLLVIDGFSSFLQPLNNKDAANTTKLSVKAALVFFKLIFFITDKF